MPFMNVKMVLIISAYAARRLKPLWCYFRAQNLIIVCAIRWAGIFPLHTHTCLFILDIVIYIFDGYRKYMEQAAFPAWLLWALLRGCIYYDDLFFSSLSLSLRSHSVPSSFMMSLLFDAVCRWGLGFDPRLPPCIMSSDIFMGCDTTSVHSQRL